MIDLFRKLAFFIYLIAICFLIAELTVRFSYSYLKNYNMEMWRYASEIKQPLPYERLPFHHHPNKEGYYYGVSVKTNSFGLRDHEHSLQKPEKLKRIIFLGDSMTFGWGVHLEKLYSKQVERMLNAKEKKIEVINMGIGNYNSIMEVELFKRKGLMFDPDMVVLMYFVNDTEPVPRIKSKVEYLLFKHSYFMAFLFDGFVRLKTSLDRDFEWSQYYLSLYGEENAANLAGNRKAVKELIEICNSNGIKLLIVNIPELRMLEEYRFHQATRYIETLAAEGGVAFLDLLPSLAGHKAESLWVSGEDPHASAFAKDIIAKQIHERISGDSEFKSLF